MALQKKLLVKRILLGCLVLLSTTAFAKEAAKQPKETPKETKEKEKDLIRYTGREVRDPTANPLLSFPTPATKETKVEEVVRLPSLQIQGIIWGGGNPQAIIDEQVVAKGDMIAGGVEILDISKSGIKVIYRGKIFMLLPKGVVEER